MKQNPFLDSVGMKFTDCLYKSKFLLDVIPLHNCNERPKDFFVKSDSMQSYFGEECFVFFHWFYTY